MMSFLFIKTSSQNTPLSKIIFWVAVLFLSIVLLFHSELPTKWLAALFIGFCLVCILLISKKVESLLIGLLILNLPFNVDQILKEFNEMGATPGIRIALVDIILLSLFVYYFLKPKTNSIHSIYSTRTILIPWGLFFIFSIFSFFSSGFPLSGLGLLMEMTRCILIFFVASRYFIDKKKIMSAIVLLSIGIMIQGVISLIQYSNSSLIAGLGVLGQSSEVSKEAWQVSGQIRPSGTFGHPNSLAQFIILILPILVAAICYKLGHRLKIVLLISFSIGQGTLMLTFSRIGWGAFFMSTILVLTIIIWKRRRTKFMVASLIIISVAVLIIVSSSNLIKQRLFSDDYGAAYIRIPMMKNAVNIISANPIFGIGINNYPATIAKFDKENLFFRVRPHPVHNEILLHFTETGVLGGLMFCWFWTAGLLAVVKCIRFNDEFTFLLAAGIFAGLFAQAIFLQVQWTYLETNQTFWVLLGICFGIRYRFLNATTAYIRNANNLI